MSFYAVICGEEWEDVAYFTNWEKALTKLISQSITYFENKGEYFPFIHLYTEIDGSFRKERYSYSVNYNKYRDLTRRCHMEDIKLHPLSIKDCVEMTG